MRRQAGHHHDQRRNDGGWRFPKVPDEGIIAWQLHAGFQSMEGIFKDIQLTDLSKPSGK
jgi:hypothetical protein